MDHCVAFGTCTGTRREDELDKDLQANLSLLRLELRELSKGAEITRKCALNGKANNARDAFCARVRFDEKKAQIDALTSRLTRSHRGIMR